MAMNEINAASRLRDRIKSHRHRRFSKRVDAGVTNHANDLGIRFVVPDTLADRASAAEIAPRRRFVDHGDFRLAPRVALGECAAGT